MWVCKYCQTELEQRRVAAHTRVCQGWKNVRNLLTHDVLRDLYETQQLSIPDIQHKFGLQSATSVYHLLKKFGIKTRTIAESIPNRNLKIVETCLSRYGQRNALSRDARPRKLMQQRLLDNENISNVFQRESVKRQCMATLLQKYGVENPGCLPRLGRKTYTKEHRRIVDACSKLGFELKIEKKLRMLNSSSYRSYDVVIEDRKILIESHGDFYHANPKRYKPTDVLSFGGSNHKTANEIWEYDLEKAKLALDNGYRLLVLWQSDSMLLTDEELVESIRKMTDDSDFADKENKEDS